MTDPAPQGAPQDPEPQGTTPPAAGAEGEGGTPPGTDWQKEARKWEARAKKDAETLTELKKQVQTLLTPEQAATKSAEAEQATRDAATAKAEALRLRVALAKGVPANLADRLVGDTQEALELDADELLSQMKTPPRTSDAAAGTGKAGGQAPPTKHDPNALLRILAGGR